MLYPVALRLPGLLIQRGPIATRTLSIFKFGQDRAINFPKVLDFEGVSTPEINWEGSCIVLRPVRPTWSSFVQAEKADLDYLTGREDIVSKK